ncbi:MAG: hypothetical protein V1900_03610 [Candidatus Aenigmatarchaeota archaeon]
MKLKRHYKILLIIVMAFIILYYLGGFLGKQCSPVKIEGCSSACWNIVATTVNSELCPSSEPCMAEPYKMQHNAITEMLTCACYKASQGNYADASLNGKIEDVFREWKGQSLKANEICSVAFVKMRY